jgi:hypothetical protein
MSAIKSKKDMKTAEEFLIERNIVIKGATSFPLNLTRDTHMKSKRDIVQAMDDYADYKHSLPEAVEHTKAEPLGKRQELIDFLEFRDKVIWESNEYTENENIVDLYVKSINSDPIEPRAIEGNEQEQEVCEKCGKNYMPRLFKPLTICDSCADGILTNFN